MIPVFLVSAGIKMYRYKRPEASGVGGQRTARPGFPTAPPEPVVRCKRSMLSNDPKKIQHSCKISHHPRILCAPARCVHQMLSPKISNVESLALFGTFAVCLNFVSGKRPFFAYTESRRAIMSIYRNVHSMLVFGLAYRICTICYLS